MKQILSISFVLLLAPVLHAATAFVQGKAAATYNADPVATFDSSATVGNVIAVLVSYHSDTVTVSSITDNCSNTYTLVRNVTAGTHRIQTAYTINASASACAVEANLSGTAAESVIVIHEISGTASSNVLDVETGQAQSGPGTGTDAITSGSVTTTVDGCYIFGATGADQYSPTISAGTNYTLRTVETTYHDAVTESRIQSSAGSIAATFTTDTSWNNYATAIMAFKPAAEAAPASRRRVITIQ